MEHSADFASTYAQMTEGELARVLRGKRSLVPQAVAALDREIKKRNLDPEQLRRQRPRSLERHRQLLTVEKRLKDKRLRWPWLVAIMVLSFVFSALLDHLGILQLFWPIVVTAAIPVFTVWGFWELKRRLWFWLIIALVVAVNTLLFSIIGWPWGTHWIPARSIAGLSTLEMIPIFALIAVLEKRQERNHQTKPSAPELSARPADKIVD